MAEDILKTIELHSKGYGLIPKLIMQDTSLHITSKAIYAYFCSYAGSGDTCFPSRNKICADLGISIDTFGKYLRQLTEKGYIECTQIKENGKFSHNVYTLCSTISPCPKISDTGNTVHGSLDTNINNSLNINSSSNNNNISVCKKESKPKNGYGEIIDSYTANEDMKEALWEFIKMRKLIKKPVTDRALKSIMNKLDTLAITDTDKIAILDQSITNSWQGVFPLKQDNNNRGDNNGDTSGAEKFAFLDGTRL